jgi:aminomethyltransferase
VLEAATGDSFVDLGYYRRKQSRLAGTEIDVSRTGYTGDLGYELWVPAKSAGRAWDALMKAGRAYEIRPAGMLALDVARLEAGLILIEVDYWSSRHAHIPEQRFSPYEIGLGRLVNLDKADFVGKRALLAEQAKGGPKRRLVGIEIDWSDVERLHAEQGLAPSVPSIAWRTAVPIYWGARQVGRLTSGTWSPTLKKLIGLGSVDAAFERTGGRLWVEWTVEARRGRAQATVVPLPFFDPPRKRA